MNAVISPLNFIGFINFFVLIFFIYGMIQILKLIREIRIIHSMTLKTILKICETKGIEIDIQKIQKEVENNL